MSGPRSKIDIPYRERANKMLTCAVEGCYRNRCSFNRYCAIHTQRKYTLGSANSRPIRRAEYRDAWIIVEKFVKKHSTHPRITEGIAALEKWMSDAQRGVHVPGKASVALLADKGAVYHSAQVFIEILAVALHASVFDNPATRAPWLYAIAMIHSIRGFPRGSRAYSRNRLGAARLPYYYSSKDRAAMQLEITRLLGDTIHEMIVYFEKMEKIRNESIANAAANRPWGFVATCSSCQRREIKRRSEAKSKAERKAQRLSSPMRRTYWQHAVRDANGRFVPKKKEVEDVKHAFPQRNG
jgi:hypothetical protein